MKFEKYVSHMFSAKWKLISTQPSGDVPRGATATEHSAEELGRESQLGPCPCPYPTLTKPALGGQ